MPPPNAPADPPPAGAVASSPALGAGRPVVASLYVLAFCSGAAALVYEVVWAKMLALTFGSTTLATAAVGWRGRLSGECAAANGPALRQVNPTPAGTFWGSAGRLPQS